MFTLALHWFLSCNHRLAVVMKVWQKSTKKTLENRPTVQIYNKGWWDIMFFIIICKLGALHPLYKKKNKFM